jgi:LuxR family transcriptional regulator, maltose regulon positive regulatory protein
LSDLTPRRAVVRALLLAAAAIERGDPTAAGVVGGVIQTARQEGCLNTVVSTAPQVTSYLIEHVIQGRRDPLIDQLVRAGLEARAAQPDASQPGSLLAEPLTPAELRVLKLLPTSTYLQIAEVLSVSRNTIKTHLRSIYQKLGVESRSQAIERAVELRLL